MSTKTALKLTDCLITTRKLPVNFQKQDLCLFKREQIKYINSYFMTKKINYIFFVSYNNIISKRLKFYLLFKATIFRRIKYFRKSTLIYVLDSWSHGYFHWMLDVLPKLYLLKRQGINGTLVLSTSCQNYRYFIESVFNFTNIIFIQEGTAVFSSKFVSIEGGPSSGNYNPEVLRCIINSIFSGFGIRGANRPFRKIYITRQNANRRKISNEAEVMKIVTINGFEVVEFEKMSFFEQALMASQCTVMAGLHGAGLSNMIFMKIGGKILEFRMPNDSVNNCYFSLSSELELKYYYLKTLENLSEEGSFEVDLIDLCLTLEKVDNSC